MLNPIFHLWNRIAIAVFITLLMSVVVCIEVTQSEDGDGIAFWVLNFDGETAMMLFDPGKGIQELFLDDFGYTRFQFSADGRIAYPASSEQGIAEIYILDTESEPFLPVNLSQEININGSPLSWSRDGHYLAFESHHDDGSSIYLWDGETVIDITPENMIGVAESYHTSWSYDGRLTFTVNFDSQSAEQGNGLDTYLWDGRDIINLSQNGGIWNKKGEVALSSSIDDAREILIWDGKSKRDGLPDASTFTHTPIIRSSGYFGMTWTDQGHLAFMDVPLQERHIQIFLWDGQTITNISQNPGLHNGLPSWSNDGRWAFSTFFSSSQLVYVRDSENRSLLTTEGYGTPAWSSDGQLIFCNSSRRGWSLLIWDGRMITEIAQGWEIWAQWQGGSGVVCSSG